MILGSDILKELKKENLLNLDLGKILPNEPMKNHTSFKIGGPVDLMIIPENEQQIINAINFAKDNNIDYFIMGNGSNLLIRDGGLKGIVIKINEGLNKITVKGNKLYCQAGVLLKDLSEKAMEYSLTGIEFANGIPGTLGGAITMNAGAYGGEMKDVVTKVRLLTRDGEIVEYTNDAMNFRYRGSRVVDDALIVLGVELQLKPGNYKAIKETMNDLIYRRNSKQPLEYPSGGSTFKRPEGYFAGKLIQDAGLKGLQHGDAQVSNKHSGFVINVGNATCEDVTNLIETIQKVVKDKFNVELEREIKLMGVDL